MWTVELTVGDHEQNGFVHLGRWQFPDEATARAFIDIENAAIPEGAEPDAKTDAFTFILDLRDGERCENMVDNSRFLPLQSAMRLAPDQVRWWLDKRPEPDSVMRLGALLPNSPPARQRGWMMGDPNDTFAKIKMLCDDITRSKTRLGYDAELMRRLGTFVFGSLDAVRDAIQALDGKSWRSAMFEEAANRAAPSEWQPIETAQKDGNFIWLSNGRSMRIGFWRDGKQFERMESVDGGWIDFARTEGAPKGPSSLDFKPTHWMPLPSPPRTEGE